MSKQKFVKGDRVVVISKCASKGRKGTVTGYVKYFWTGKAGVCVSLDGGSQLTYNERSLKKIGETQIKEENNVASNEVQGNYRVAMVRHVQNCANHNTVKVYAFAVFDDNIIIGDKVLCDSEGGYSVAEVIDIKSKMEYSQAHSRVVTKEIICKVDFSEFEERVAKRREMASIRAEMDKLVAENQDMILYQAIAEKNPQMAVLLERYNTINNI